MDEEKKAEIEKTLADEIIPAIKPAVEAICEVLKVLADVESKRIAMNIIMEAMELLLVPDED